MIYLTSKVWRQKPLIFWGFTYYIKEWNHHGHTASVTHPLSEKDYITTQKTYIRKKGLIFPLSHYSAITRGILPVSQPPKLGWAPVPFPLTHLWFCKANLDVSSHSPLCLPWDTFLSVLLVFSCLSSPRDSQIRKVSKCIFSFTRAQYPAVCASYTSLIASWMDE